MKKLIDLSNNEQKKSSFDQSDFGLARIMVSRLTNTPYSISGILKYSEEDLTQIRNFASSLRSILIKRNDLLGFSGFRDPSWGMMLEALCAFIESRKVSISSLCLASGVPLSTALRSLKQLEKHGMLRRENDTRDLRRVWVTIDPIKVQPLVTILISIIKSAQRVVLTSVL